MAGFPTDRRDGRLLDQRRPIGGPPPTGHGRPRIGASVRGCQGREVRNATGDRPRDSWRHLAISSESRNSGGGRPEGGRRLLALAGLFDGQAVRCRYRRLGRHKPGVLPREVLPALMSSLTEATIIDALRHVQEPELGRDIVSLDMVKAVAIDGTNVAFTIELTTPACPLKDEIESNARRAIQDLGATDVAITWGAMVRR